MKKSQASSGREIAVSAPLLDGNEARYVADCVESSWVSSTGRYITAFEEEFASFCGVKHAVSTNNGTTALHLALLGLGLKPEDEVIVPSLTYIATANAVRYCGAKPVFVDNDPRHFNLDPRLLATKLTPRTRGIIAVHLYGHPAEMGPIVEFAREHNLWVLEDAAEAHGAKYKGERVGGIGDCATFSFFGNKIITTGEGGMVTTNDDELAKTMRLLRGQGMDPARKYWFPVVGYNYRMTNLAAAIGLAQMERIECHLKRRAEVAAGYDRRLARYGDFVVRPYTAPWAEHVFWMYTVKLGPKVVSSRDKVIARMAEHGIETRPVFYPMHVLPPYAEERGDLINSVACSTIGINLPTHGLLSEEDLDRVCSVLLESVT
jgi:perosamine synthetase